MLKGLQWIQWGGEITEEQKIKAKLLTNSVFNMKNKNIFKSSTTTNRPFSGIHFENKKKA